MRENSRSNPLAPSTIATNALAYFRWLRDFSQFKPSALALIAANVLPLLGVFVLGWDAFAIVVVYWTENVVIGLINILKMITCCPGPEAVAELERIFPDQQKEPENAQQVSATPRVDNKQTTGQKVAHHLGKLFFIPFFVVHYGLFCLIHGAFIFALFGHDTVTQSGRFGEVGSFFRVLTDEHLWWAIIPLAASHLYSFFVNYLGRGEYRRTFVPLLMVQPYARIVVLHIAILFGGFVAMALGSNIGVLALLIVGKTVLDLTLHLREHERSAERQYNELTGSILDETIRRTVQG